MHKVIYSQEAPRPAGVYSQAIVADSFVFVSGQGPTNPATRQMELGDFRNQVRRTLRNVRAILEASGSSLNDVVRIGVYLAEMSDFAALNEVFLEFFPETPPARTTIGVVLPLAGMKVEIDCIARVRKPKGQR